MHPIIYIHKGCHDYLEISIKQSLKDNNKIILIGDEKNQSLAKKYGIKHVFFDKFNKNDFSKYYVHNKEKSNYQFELMCYERRFVLYEVMKELKIDKCLYLDSDILFYGNIDNEFSRILTYGNFDLAFPKFSGHTTYVFSQNALRKFCDYIMSCYKDVSMYKKLLNRPLIYQSGISDMSIFQLYFYNFPDLVFDLTLDHGDNIIYDGFINIDEGYKTYCGKKNFKLISGIPFVKDFDNKSFQIKTLHFQMHMKSYMGLVFSGNILIYKILLLFNSIAEWFYFKFKFVRNLRKIWKDRNLFN